MYIRHERCANNISPLGMGFTKKRKPLPKDPVYEENNELRDIVDMHVRVNGLYKNDNFNFATVDYESSRRIDDFEARKSHLYNAFNLGRLIKSNSRLGTFLCKFVQKYHIILMDIVDAADTRVLDLLKGYKIYDELFTSSVDLENHHIHNPNQIEALHRTVIELIIININIDKQLWDTVKKSVKKSDYTTQHAVTCANNFESRVYPIIHPDMCPSNFVVPEGHAEVIDSLIQRYEETLNIFMNKCIQYPQDLEEDKNLTTFMILQVQSSKGLCVPYGEFVNHINCTTFALVRYRKNFDAHRRKLASAPPLPESYHVNSLHPQNAGDDYKYLDYP